MVGKERVRAWLYGAGEVGPVILFHTAAGVTPREHALARHLTRTRRAVLLVRYAARTSGAILQQEQARQHLERIADAALAHAQTLCAPAVGGIAVVGLSLGGYLAAWLVGHAATALDAAVVLYGVYPATEEWLATNPVRLLVLQGDRDADQFVESARRLAERRKDAAVRFVPGAVHQFDLLQPWRAATRRALVETIAFLRTPESARQTPTR
jgi:dienelactone hydrolase